jgi:hypothetical protein
LGYLYSENNSTAGILEQQIKQQGLSIRSGRNAHRCPHWRSAALYSKKGQCLALLTIFQRSLGQHMSQGNRALPAKSVYTKF